MQKVKRKAGEGDTPTPKKKKVQFKETEKETKTENAGVKKNVVKAKKEFNGKPKAGDKKFNKFDKGKGDKKFNKFDKSKTDKFNKFGKGKPNFSKDKKLVKGQAEGEKPVWSEMKKEKKQLRIVRRKAKTSAEVFEISHKAKLLAAQIQRKTVEQEFKQNACKELHTLLKGQYKSIALTHDLSRVIQVLLKHSPEEIRNEITEELLELMVQMVQSKYGQHAVKRIIKYGSQRIRHEVIKRFFGHIVSLAAHTISAPVLDFAYNDFATKKEKTEMQQEFYGEIYKNTKDSKVKTLSDTYKDSPEMKTAILQSCKANIQRILDKNLHDGELLHSVLYDYIRECSAEQRAELVSSLASLIVPLSNSLPGANAACMCVWQGTNKDKKTILKVVKEHAVPLSKHKTGYRLLLAIFDAVDDTVLVKKAIVAALEANLKDVARDHWGNMTLHWLVKPKDTTAFHPELIKFFNEGSKSGTSKKDPELRVSELREGILPALVKDMAEDPKFWISDKNVMLLTVAVLSIKADEEIAKALASEICQPDWKVKREDKELPAIEDAALHMCLKKMAALDKGQDGVIGKAFAEALTSDTIKVWLPTNRGCYFLLNLIENNAKDVADKIRKKIKPHSDLLKQQTTQGAKLLLQNVNK